MINFLKKLFKLKPKSKPEVKNSGKSLDETFEFFKDKLVDNPTSNTTLAEAVKISQKSTTLHDPNEFVKGLKFDSSNLDSININSLPTEVREKIVAVIRESKVKNTVE